MSHLRAAMSLAQARQAFPALQGLLHGRPLCYLDNAATTQLPQSVIEAVSSYYRRGLGAAQRSVHGLASQAELTVARVREQLRGWLRARSCAEVVFTSGATQGLNMLAAGLGELLLQPGDRVVVSALEHHANLLPWHAACAARGAQLCVLPLPAQGRLEPALLLPQLGPRTKVVALPYVSNVLGTVQPVRALAEAAHAHGACLVVDAAQAAGHLPLDVQALGCDFLVFSAHKMYGPTGVGVLYGRSQWLERLPPYHLGGGMVRRVALPQLSYEPLPHRLEAGTLHVAGIAGLGAAVQFIESIGWPALQAHEQALATYMREGLRALPGLRLLPGSAPQLGIASFTLQGHHHLDVAALLDSQGIALRAGHHCAHPLMKRYGVSATVRASFAAYNTRDDVDRFIEALTKAKRILS